MVLHAPQHPPPFLLCSFVADMPGQDLAGPSMTPAPAMQAPVFSGQRPMSAGPWGRGGAGALDHFGGQAEGQSFR